MSSETFVSHAQNREDVVLHRALGHLDTGRYIDVGANDPTEDSVTRAFYDRGWRGITVEPVAADAARQRTERPGDLVVEAAATDHDGGTVEFFSVSDSRLSTLVDGVGQDHLRHGWGVERIQVASRRLDSVLTEHGWDTGDIHFLSVDTEGAEGAVLTGLDLTRFRPWVLVVEATRPQSSEPSHQDWEHLVVSAGYRFVLFDGLSRFYVAQEHADELAPRLSAPANVLDPYVLASQVRSDAELDRLTHATVDLESARQAQLVEIDRLRGEIDHYDKHLAHVTNQAERDQADAVAAERHAAQERENAGAERERAGVERERAGAERERAAAERSARDVEAIMRWRRAALDGWSAAVAAPTGPAGPPEAVPGELLFLRAHHHEVTQELDRIRQTLSWRVTRPLRLVRRLSDRVGR